MVSNRDSKNAEKLENATEFDRQFGIALMERTRTRKVSQS